MCQRLKVDYGDTIEIQGTCTVTGDIYKITLDSKAYWDWKEGNELIQNVFPQLTSDQREFLISGTTPAEWKKLFGDPDD